MGLSFRLTDDFIDGYKAIEPKFGFRDAGGNSVGELTFIRTYSRVKKDGSKERWHEVCRRVVEGMYSIQKDWAVSNRLPWNANKAQASAKEAYDRLFNLKWTPPGRGLWMMGTDFVHERGMSAALVNCAAVSTGDIDRHDPGAIFAWIADALMLGIGVGFDTKGSEKNIVVHERKPSNEVYVIPDSREGWAESFRILVNSYLRNNRVVNFDYSLIREYGQPIKGFGGVSSGKDPLVKVHKQISDVFESRIGDNLDSRLITDIINLIGTCIVSGNVRRAAEIAIGDADDKEFLDLKNYSVNPERAEFGWMSNNTVSIPNQGFDYDEIAKRILDNGEPGISWIDTARAYGRLGDPRNDKDFRVTVQNPCLPADAYLFTDTGLVTFGDAYLNGGSQRILSDRRISFDKIGEDNDPANWSVDLSSRGSEFVDATHVFLTQRDAEVVKVETSNGYSVRVTPDHLIATKNGMVPAGELTPGEKILVTPAPLPLEPLSYETIEEKSAFLVGLIAGDGWFQSKKVTDIVSVGLWGNDRQFASTIRQWIKELFDKYSGDYLSGFKHFTHSYTTENDKLNKSVLSSAFLSVYLNDVYSFNKDTKHVVPKILLRNARSAEARAYIAGLAFADGSVDARDSSGSSSINISQSNRSMLSDVQMLLLANGIMSGVYLVRKEGMRPLPNGRGGYRECKTKAQYRLVISMHAYEYAKYVGFGDSHKQAKADGLFTSPSRKFNAYATVSCVSEDGREDVYCLSEPTRHSLVANGLAMRQCNEIYLESFEVCNLAELYLTNHESLDDFLRSIKFAYLYCKTVTLLPTHWPQTNAVVLRNRRIGPSVTGIAEFVENHGLPEFRKWADAGYDLIQEYDKTYSEWLCVRESIKTTSVKPSGSVSLLGNSTPGVHWPVGGEYYLRAIRFSNDDAALPLLRNAGYRVEEDLYSANTSVAYFPIHSKVRRSERDVSVYEKLHLAAEAQEVWADNAVSVTVTFDPESEGDAIARLLRMYEGRLKSVSFLPLSNDTYPQMPYTNISKEEYDSHVGRLQKIDMSILYDGTSSSEAAGDMYCTTDTCEIPQRGIL